MLRILTDRGTEYCGRVDQHDYQLYLAINGIDHSKTKATWKRDSRISCMELRNFIPDRRHFRSVGSSSGLEPWTATRGTDEVYMAKEY